MSRLTKSKFKTAVECSRKLYYVNNAEYADKNNNDTFLSSLSDGGYQVAALAKLYYPGGHIVEDTEYNTAIATTNQLLQKENVIIYEAAIEYENLFARVDILVKKGNTIQLIEVKAKSCKGNDPSQFFKDNGSIKKDYVPYLYDIAFQKYVFINAFPDFKVKGYLMFADKTKTTSVDGLNQKFNVIKDFQGNTSIEVLGEITAETIGNKILSEIDVDEIITKIFNDTDFNELLQLFSNACRENTILNTSIGSVCKRCEFNCNEEGKINGFRQCWMEQTKLVDADFDNPLILDLWYNRNIPTMLENNIYLLSNISQANIGNDILFDGELTRNERQWLQVEKVRDNDNTPYLDTDGLDIEIRKYKYPFHFIDFETCAVAIPFHNGRKPYETVAFQFSHHIMEEDGSIRHANQFLHSERGAFPNYDFLRALKNALENDKGTIFRYAAHENTVLKHIKDQLINEDEIIIPEKEELLNFISSITKDGERSMVDMRELVMKYHYDPYMKGSISIKSVLPAILKRSHYIQNKYNQEIYGRDAEIKSLNYIRPYAWIQYDENRNVMDPYKLLPSIFEGYTREEIDELFISNEKLKDGGEAMTAYARMQSPKMSNQEINQISDGLKRYCELDTLAMVMIFEYWLHEINEGNNRGI